MTVHRCVPHPKALLVVKYKVTSALLLPFMPQEEKTTAVRDGQNDERYDAQRIESKWFERWQQDPVALRR